MSAIDKLGRKTLLVVGTLGVCVFLATVGHIFRTGSHGSWLIGLLIGLMGSSRSRRVR